MSVPPDAALTCPACQAEAAHKFPILHHMLCAYVGPSYDFPLEAGEHRCPKCRRPLKAESTDWEIAGDCLLCEPCGAETHL